MKNIFKNLLIEFHNTKIPQPSLRTLDLSSLSDELRKAYVFIGMRRSGKTWCLYQHMNSLLQEGIKTEQILYLNFSDDRLLNITGSDLKFVLDAYQELYPQYIDDPNVHFFFDEIQDVQNWENFVRRLLDTEKMSIYITGSSAKMLSREISTSLGGRVITREIFPFSFHEYLQCIWNKSISSNMIPKILLRKGTQKDILREYLQDFLKNGGFPEAVILHRNTTTRIMDNKTVLEYVSKLVDLPKKLGELLQSYVESVIYRDIVERYKISNIQAVKGLLVRCLQNSASLFSINKTHNILKSQGYAVSTDSLYEYMKYFEDAYCIFSVPIYNFSANKRMLTPKKIYPIDQGLITAYTVNEAGERSHRLETAVFSHLRRNNKEIYYYHTQQDSKEVDFLTLSPKGEMALYQVAESIKEPETYQREVSALKEAMLELDLKTGIIVTLEEEQEIKTTNGKIFCIPLLRFLLEHADKTPL